MNHPIRPPQRGPSRSADDRAPLIPRMLRARALGLVLLLSLLHLAGCTWGEVEELPFTPGEPTSELPPLERADGATPDESPLTGVRHAALPAVSVWGSMRRINAEGDPSATTTLQEAFASVEGSGELVALGNLAGLRGEITVRGARTHLTRPCEDGHCVEVLNTSELDPEISATLLIAARVDAWHEVHAPETLDMPGLAAFIDKLREERGLGGAPMPFLIIGVLDELEGHVVDIEALGSEVRGTCAERATRLPGIAVRDASAELVAFHDPGAPGRIVSHERPIHVHAILEDDRSLHVDNLRIPAGTRIRIPQTER